MGIKWFWLFCAVAWFGSQCYWSTLHTNDTPLALTGMWFSHDFFRHMCVFGLLTFFVFMAVYRMPYPYLVAFFVVGFLGLIDEFHQSFRPTRGFEASDFLADITGATLMLSGLWLSNRIVSWFWKIRFHDKSYQAE